MEEELLTVRDIAKLYKTTEGAIRAAIWRSRHFGTDPGFPPPMLVRRRFACLKSIVMDHMKSLARLNEIQTIESAKAGRSPET